MIALRDIYRFRKSNNIIFDIRSVSWFSYYRDKYVNVHRNSITFFDWISLCVISFDLIEYYIISSLIRCESSIALKSTANRCVYGRISVSIFGYWVEFKWKIYYYNTNLVLNFNFNYNCNLRVNQLSWVVGEFESFKQYYFWIILKNKIRVTPYTPPPIY